MSDTKLALHAYCSPTVHNTATVDTHGMKVDGLTIHGHAILTAAVRGDGKRGATHPCSPLFGPERNTSFGLSQHGPVRNTLASSMRMDDGSAELYTHVNEHEYPSGLIIRQLFKLEADTFSITTIHENTGRTPVPVNFGEHFYWNAPDGWDGVMLNGENVTDLVKKNGTAPLTTVNTISIPGQPEIRLEQQGMPCAVLWAYRNPETESYDHQYVCIEPAERDPASDFFGTQESMIAPGKTRTTFLAITVGVPHV